MGVISRPGDSLFPDGLPITLVDVPAVRIGGSPPAGAPQSVICSPPSEPTAGCRWSSARPPGEAVRVLAATAADFDQWTEVGTVPAGAAAHALAGVDLAGGTRSAARRVLARTASPGSVIFVTDPDLVLIRPG